MTGCTNTQRPGCHGMLCRSAHASLRQLKVFRYPADNHGRPDYAGQPETGWVCALVSFRPSSADGSVDIPGVLGGRQPIHLIAAAGSFDVPLAAGDRVEVQEGTWRVSSVSMGQMLTAELIFEEVR